MTEPTKAADTENKPAESEHYTVKVSANEPEMAMLPGGVFVMSIPFNSKGMNKVLALGWTLTAVFRVYEMYNDFERIKREHKSRIKNGDLSMLTKIKEAAGGIFFKP